MFKKINKHNFHWKYYGQLVPEPELRWTSKPAEQRGPSLKPISVQTKQPRVKTHNVQTHTQHFHRNRGRLTTTARSLRRFVQNTLKMAATTKNFKTNVIVLVILLLTKHVFLTLSVSSEHKQPADGWSGVTTVKAQSTATQQINRQTKHMINYQKSQRFPPKNS